MAVNLISSEDIEIQQTGNDIQLNFKNPLNNIGIIKQGFGDIFTSDGTYTGTLYSNVVGKYIGNGIWEITTDGQIEYSNAGSNYFNYGLSITKIGNLLGLSLTNPVSGNKNLYSKYYFYNSNGQIDRDKTGYGPFFEYHSNINSLTPARIYTTSGSEGGWPMHSFTSGGYFVTTIYLKEV